MTSRAAVGGWPLTASRGVVRMLAVSRRGYGICTCGWVGRQRRLHGLAVYDALEHATTSGCLPARPLVFR
ncbi:hypothetical protein [Mycolicibacterium canariasense]|uniref:hypothetical protein n=1 Tax=Mycolicibacterium canariasense TaxID=228230 RepID=UPI000788C543|nr:hypothetical protein [Mycolicibacterium canariasense]MCV7212505.1 hypothetical protein [Mycolicibacterium canariasense]ORU95393.1 hypothetical protein AWB94_31520 [Mycolicibacterium canariasense]